MEGDVQQPQQRSALGAFGGFGGGSAAAAAPVVEPIEIKPEDFDTFEKMLGDVQTAYGREDLAALRPQLTPEMLSYYAEELSENASRGVVNEISDVKLLQGDLAEAWREDGKDYASVAMRYSLKDRYVDRATGKAAEGNEAPQEATEVWTFTRAPGGPGCSRQPSRPSDATQRTQQKPGSDAGLFVLRRLARAPFRCDHSPTKSWRTLMEIKPSGSVPTRRQPKESFTGVVWQDRSSRRRHRRASAPDA